MRVLILLLTLFALNYGYGQSAATGHKCSLQLTRKVALQSDHIQLRPTFELVRDKADDDLEVDLQQANLELKRSKASGAPTGNFTARSSRAAGIEIGTQFVANATTTMPPDYAIAINGTGQIISAVNANVNISDTFGNLLYTKSLLGHIQGNDSNITILSSRLCDPRIRYDCTNHRFMMAAITCDALASTSQIVVMTSTSEDPLSDWNVYTIKGDFLNKGYWFDHPSMAFSKSDLFISGNLYSGTALTDAYLFQIDKQALFNGDTAVPMVHWDNFSSKGNSTLMPVGEGRCGDYGDSMYVLSLQRPGQAGGPTDTVSIYTIVGKAASANLPVRTDIFIQLPETYNNPVAAVQAGTTIGLNPGDARLKDAYYLNGIIHSVHTTVTSTQYNGIYYARLTASAQGWQAQNYVLAVSAADLSYPSIVNWGTASAPQVSLIHVAHSPSQAFPGSLAFIMNNDMSIGDIFLVDTGKSYVNKSPSNNMSRWGDYSAICRNFNASGREAWTFMGSGNTAHGWTNVISKISEGFPTGVADAASESGDAQLYPVPADQDLVTLKFNNHKPRFITMKVMAMNGAITEVPVSSTYLGAGEHRIQFSTRQLAAGIYAVALESEGNLLVKKRFTVR